MNPSTIVQNAKAIVTATNKTLYRLIDNVTSRKMSRFTEIMPGLISETTLHVSKGITTKQAKDIAEYLTEKCGFTQKTVALLLGKAQSTISNWLRK